MVLPWRGATLPSRPSLRWRTRSPNALEALQVQPWVLFLRFT